jgi:zinc protease
MTGKAAEHVSRLLVFFCVLCAACPTYAADQAAPEWPQAHSDIPADPSIVFGQLPNGMRYLIRHNASPAGAIALRLRIAAGSLDESDPQEGIAHFIEHMAFRGSTHFADGEAFKMLQSRGADSNAQTSPDQTIFIIDLPNNQPSPFDSALLFLRDVGSEVLFDPKALDSERAVVLAEARQRDTVAVRAWKARDAQILGPRVVDAMLPIGKNDVIKGATADLLKAFYRSYYRPERATLVVVGDVDPKEIEAKIRAQFADWRNASPPPMSPSYAPVLPTKPIFGVYSEPTVNRSVEITWAEARQAGPDSVARLRGDLIRAIGFNVLVERLQKLSTSEDPPFEQSSGANGRSNEKIAVLSWISAAYGPGQSLAALRALTNTYTSASRDGLAQDEVMRSIGRFRVAYQGRVAAAQSTPSWSLANLYVNTVDYDEVIRSPEESLSLFESVVRDLKTDDVTQALREIFSDHGPAVFATSPDVGWGGKDALASAFATPLGADATAASETKSKPWPYERFGAPGTVISRTTIPDLDLTQITFANGVRATIKSTKFRGGQIIVSAKFGHGRLGLPKTVKSPAWALPGAYIDGGLGKMRAEEIQELFADKKVDLGMNTLDDGFVVQGETRPEDFPVELQLLAAQFADPAWRPEAFRLAQSTMSSMLTRVETSPSSVFSLHLGASTHGGDPRWAVPSPDEVRAVKLSDVKALVRDALDGGSLEIVVVGDIGVDDAIKELRSTVGALPGHFAAPRALAGDEELPKQTSVPTIFTHQAGPDRAFATLVWPTTGFFPDVQEPRTLRVLELVMARRAFDTLRTRAGMTYSPVTTSFASLNTPSFGYLAIGADILMARIPEFYQTIAEMTADLRAHAVTQEELARARDPRVQDLLQQQQTNAYWITLLTGSQADPRRLDLIRSTIPDMEKVTSADVLSAAQKYLKDDPAWKVIVLPEGNESVPAATGQAAPP